MLGGGISSGEPDTDGKGPAFGQTPGELTFAEDSDSDDSLFGEEDDPMSSDGESEKSSDGEEAPKKPAPKKKSVVKKEEKKPPVKKEKKKPGPKPKAKPGPKPKAKPGPKPKKQTAKKHSKSSVPGIEDARVKFSKLKPAQHKKLMASLEGKTITLKIESVVDFVKSITDGATTHDDSAAWQKSYIHSMMLNGTDEFPHPPEEEEEDESLLADLM